MTTPEFYDLIECSIKIGQQNPDSDASSLYPRISRNTFTQKFVEFGKQKYEKYFEQYQKSMTISADLEKDRNLITDPILHRTIKNNVRVLQFCNTEETIGSLPVHNSHSSNENDVPIASYVKKSRRMMYY